MSRIGKKIVRESGIKQPKTLSTKLKVGDKVMIISGGNSTKKKLKGVTGTIKKFLPKNDRVIVDGANYVKRHKRATQMGESPEIVTKEAGVHISNIMFYSDEVKGPVKLKSEVIDGVKVRGFINKESGQFVKVD